MNLIEKTRETLKFASLNIHDRILFRCEEALIGNYNQRKDLKICEKTAMFNGMAYAPTISIKNYIN